MRTRGFCSTRGSRSPRIDVKKLGRIRGVGHRVTADRGPGKRNRGIGWDFVHVCIDDYSRLAYVEIQPDEHPATAVAFLRRALGWFAQRGVRVERVMTDTATPTARSCTTSPAASSSSNTSAPGPPAPAPTSRPSASYRPCSANGRTGPSTAPPTNAPKHQSRLKHYNYTRRHGSLSHKPPGPRLNNQARNYT